MKYKNCIITIILVLILTIYLVISRPQDDIVLMEKLISKHLHTKQSINIYNAISVDNYKFVSYILSDKDRYEKVGYSNFELNSKGKYEFLNVIEPDKITEIASDIIIYEFSNLRDELSNLITDEVSINPSIFIISNNPKLSKIERIIDNGEILEKEIVGNPSISFIDDLEGSKSAEYNFYDMNGDIIE